MAHGQPDFGQYAAKSTVYPQADFAEIAARLGSICTYDRRGDVIFLEDFTNELTRWTATKFGTGATVAISNNRFKSRGFSAKLTTGSTSTGEAGLHKYFAVPIYSRIGLEASFAVPSTFGNLWFYIRVHTGTEYHQWGAVYNVKNGTLGIQDSSGAIKDLSLASALYADDSLFHTIKLVGDFSTNKYSRVLLDNVSVDLSGEDCYIVSNVANPYLQITFSFFPDPLANVNGYLDDIILTQNEP